MNDRKVKLEKDGSIDSKAEVNITLGGPIGEVELMSYCSVETIVHAEE